MKFSIKTTDGNRNEMPEPPHFVHMYEMGWLVFDVPGGGVKYLNPAQVVSITEREEE